MVVTNFQHDYQIPSSPPQYPTSTPTNIKFQSLPRLPTSEINIDYPMTNIDESSNDPLAGPSPSTKKIRTGIFPEESNYTDTALEKEIQSPIRPSSR
ncbi:hypothetical protein GcC1_038031 [Golovinomyces cichoracearum]|uniref:Uncharacterized protein n=1 Tax=Golovinomyces cichoracearum TaxID=62708 RepID=A0A420J077_9PEZI|nr:hypothetical protein GcC1_038031 [Golovinomyces cichoracearum]